jgi:hypothetical protein
MKIYDDDDDDDDNWHDDLDSELWTEDALNDYYDRWKRFWHDNSQD